MYRQEFKEYKPYKIDKIAKFDLGNNENRVIDWSFLPQKTLENLEINQLTFYGDNRYSELIEQYSDYVGKNPKQVTVGVGSDYIIHMIVTAFLTKDDTFLTVNPDFFMYQVYNDMHGSRFKAVDLLKEEDTLVLPVEQLLQCATENNAKVIMISNPNNPSSIAYSLEDLERLASSFEGLVVIDEAYIEFANIGSFMERVDQFDNVLVLRTLSKAFGLAGLRLGFAVGSERLIYELDKVMPPFSLPNLTVKMGSIALEHKEQVMESVQTIIQLREDMIGFLKEFPDCHVLLSQASFVTFKAPWAEEFYKQALANDWNFKYYPAGFLAGYIRLSIGRVEEMKMMKQMIKNMVEKGTIL